MKRSTAIFLIPAAIVPVILLFTAASGWARSSSQAAPSATQPATRATTQQPGTAPAPSGTFPAPRPHPVPETQPAPDPFASLSFLKGTWAGPMNEDDFVEETWSGPKGDNILGMFRWIDADGTTTMTELLSIHNDGGMPTLRLRHFSVQLEPFKNEANGVAGLKLAEFSHQRAVFKNSTDVGMLLACEYHCPTPNELKITVTFREEGRPALKFDLKRVTE